jgi:hypothetical protein
MKELVPSEVFYIKKQLILYGAKGSLFNILSILPNRTSCCSSNIHGNDGCTKLNNVRATKRQNNTHARSKPNKG